MNFKDSTKKQEHSHTTSTTLNIDIPIQKEDRDRDIDREIDQINEEFNQLYKDGQERGHVGRNPLKVSRSLDLDSFLTNSICDEEEQDDNGTSLALSPSTPRYQPSKPSHSTLETPRCVNVLLSPQRIRAHSSPSKVNNNQYNNNKSFKLQQQNNNLIELNDDSEEITTITITPPQLNSPKNYSSVTNSPISTPGTSSPPILLSPTGSVKLRSRNTSLSYNSSMVITKSPPTLSPSSSSTSVAIPNIQNIIKRSNTDPIHPSFFYPDSPIGSPQVMRVENKQLNEYEMEFSRPNLIVDNDESNISLPYNFQHIKHVDKTNKRDVEDYIIEKHGNLKQGWLGLRVNNNSSTVKSRYFVIQDSKLTIYKDNNMDKIKLLVNIYDVMVYPENNGLELKITLLNQEQNNNNNPSSLLGKISMNQIGQKNWNMIATSPFEIKNWCKALLSDGATYGVLLDYEKKIKEIKKQKDEETYIQQSRLNRLQGKRTSLELGKPLQDDQLLFLDWVCNHKIISDHHSSSLKKVIIQLEFIIHGDYHQDQPYYYSSWTIQRSLDQLKTFYKMVSRSSSSFIKNILNQKEKNDEIGKKDSSSFSTLFKSNSISTIEQLDQNIGRFIKMMVGDIENKRSMLENPKLRKEFIKFSSPLQWNDIKPVSFVYPINPS
ncbi:hypothetical protein DFA_09539 [Cavenderia fasciculata]|uniref:PH domain-containing protein n=1 Tax=Cavenderia fasciculata TaxID=261658 RepID=F4Q7X0_CACFS|nr:uncharacterized protein DFA_09539 [Cavenderia fasciculata]EGG15870.1 hypothetical protein DFA_09539 [Cavenderia fasciculata]|eukprot:XP_004352195.1 hypothetical protein DFA_09539 [Cavenderia fasciculata]